MPSVSFPTRKGLDEENVVPAGRCRRQGQAGLGLRLGYKDVYQHLESIRMRVERLLGESEDWPVNALHYWRTLRENVRANS